MNHCCKEHKGCHKKAEKKDIIFYSVSILLFLLALIPWKSQSIKIVFYIVSILLSGYELIWQGIKNLVKLHFEEDTLMAIAIIAAFILGEYPESVLVLLLYKLGEMIEERAEKKSQDSIQKIAQMKADTANLIQEDGTDQIVKVENLLVGQKIRIKPGEKVPVDCEIIEGRSYLDTSSLTGESKEADVGIGNIILSGSINLTGKLEARVEKDFQNSTATQIVDLVYQATNQKGRTEKFITKFAKVYTPIVILLALGMAVIPASLGILDFSTWIYRALVFLVASCPCSIVISIPLAFFSCIGSISKQGMLIKGTKHIENLAKTTAICLDKTGTLTTGNMKIGTIEIWEDMTKEEILFYIQNLEAVSNHPISTAVNQLGNSISKVSVEEYEEILGYGIYGKIQNKEVMIGNLKLLEKYEVNYPKKIENAIYVVIDKKAVGYMILEEEIRKESKHIVANLNKIGVQKIVMLTGDSKTAANHVGAEIGISEIYSSILPKQKQEIVEKMKQKEKVIFVGDGINDSPVLASSDFGIAMGSSADIASSVADGILLSNQILAIPNCIKTARKTMKIVKENISVSLGIKFLVLILGFIGIAPIWLAIVADTGMTLLTVLNCLRITK